jgi:hypothetical protein
MATHWCSCQDIDYSLVKCPFSELLLDICDPIKASSGSDNLELWRERINGWVDPSLDAIETISCGNDSLFDR